MEKIDENFGMKFKAFRNSKNMSQKELAERLGVTTSMISKYEAGINYPSFAGLLVMRDLGADLSIFFGDAEARLSVIIGMQHELRRLRAEEDESFKKYMSDRERIGNEMNNIINGS